MSKLKQLFPNHKLGDKDDYELQQFTANDMIEFAESVAEESLKRFYKNLPYDLEMSQLSWQTLKKAFNNRNNIPEL